MNVSYFTDSAARDCGQDIGDGGQHATTETAARNAAEAERFVSRVEAQTSAGREQWKPTEQPYRVTAIIPCGSRWDQYRTVVRTFATEAEARAYAATVPSKNRPLLTVAVNADTWTQNGRWQKVQL